MERKKLPVLPDYNHCLVNLSNSILKHFGAETTAKTLPLADRYLEGENQNIVVLLLDALGSSILEKHLDPDGFSEAISSVRLIPCTRLQRLQRPPRC